MTLVVRTQGKPHLLIEPIRREVQLENRDLALVDVRTLEDQVREGSASVRLSATLLGIACATELPSHSV